MTEKKAGQDTRRKIAALAVTALLIPLCLDAASAASRNNTSPDVIVNLQVLGQTAPASAAPLRLPQRIIDGEEVIVLTPPSLQKKKKAMAVVKPRIKPALALPKTAPVATAKAAPKKVPTPKVKTAAKAPTPKVKPAMAKKVPAAPVTAAIEPEKLPAAPLQEPAKTATIAEPATLNSASTLPSPKETAETKAKMAQSAAEKVAPEASANAAPETASKEDSLVVASIAPAAGPAAAATAVKEAASAERRSRILFAKGDASLNDAADKAIQKIADSVKASPRETVQLFAYGTGDSVSAARRLSLGRALAVRSKLMSLGVENTRIEVRALGKPEGDDPANRVDLVLIAR